MSEINNVVLVGRLTRDAELKYTQGGLAITRFALAINRRKKVGEQWQNEANFFDVSILGKTAESVHKFLVKGKLVAVQGELRQERWEQDGQHRSKVGIVAFNVQLLSPNQGAAGATTDQAEAAGFSTSSDDFQDDIPF